MVARVGTSRILRAATRGSTLARLQTDLVGAMLGPDVGFEPLVVSTMGDRRADVGIGELGGQGVFVREVQEAVLDGRADIAVHSAKDLPSTAVDGLVIGAFPVRADPRDALVGSSLAALVPGARVGTGSARRRAQLLALRPDLTVVGLRGNMETRLAKAFSAQMDAAVVAVAALERLGRRSEAAEVFNSDAMVPQVGQGALAVECRSDDEATLALLAGIDHAMTRRAVEAERAWLRTVGGGCDLPVGAHAVVDPATGRIHLVGLLTSVDGSVVIRHSGEGDDAGDLGRAVASHMLGVLGGRDLLATAAATAGGSTEAPAP